MSDTPYQPTSSSDTFDFPLTGADCAATAMLLLLCPPSSPVQEFRIMSIGLKISDVARGAGITKPDPEASDEQHWQRLKEIKLTLSLSVEEGRILFAILAGASSHAGKMPEGKIHAEVKEQYKA